VELSAVVAGKHKPNGRTLFKSGGVALEDVAVASMVYDKAMKSGDRYPNIELS
jgi:ornithine cyclodeaminase/alanine dehydrogenase-like protein (mu-crystallin family)